MKIRVELHGELRSLASELTLIVPQGATLNQLLFKVVEQGGEAIRRKVFNSEGKLLPQPLLKILVNGTHTEFERKLADGDVVTMFPLESIGGG